MSYPEASTQYNDYRGTAALDEHGGGFKGLADLAAEKGLDLDKYGPVLGFRMYGVDDPHYCAVYVADKSKMNGATVAEYAAEHNGEVPLVEANFAASSAELATAIKRLDVAVFSNKSAMESATVTEEIQLD